MDRLLSRPRALATCAAVRWRAPEISTDLIDRVGPNHSQPSRAHSATATPAAIARRSQWTSGSFRFRSERVHSWPLSGAASSALGLRPARGSSDLLLRNFNLIQDP